MGELILNATNTGRVCLHCGMPHASWVESWHGMNDEDVRMECLSCFEKNVRFTNGDFETFPTSPDNYLSITYSHTASPVVESNEIILKFV